MPEETANPEPIPHGVPEPLPKMKRRLVAAMLSTVVPGAGQLLLGQRRKAILLFAILLAASIGFWPLRLSTSFPGLILLFWACLLLCLYAIYDALFSRTDPPQAKTSRWWLLACIPLTYIGVNVVFTPLLLGSGFRAFEVASSSMEPNLVPGEKFIADMEYFHRHVEGRGDLVMVRWEKAPTIKRIIAVGGDTVQEKDREVALNGQTLTEPFVQHEFAMGRHPELDSFAPIVVPKGKYFVMGDNRDISLDSRTPEFGLVDEGSIVGKPLYIYRSAAKGKHWRSVD